MYTPINSHGDSIDALRTAFRHAAEANLQQHRDDAEARSKPLPHVGIAASEFPLRTAPSYPQTRPWVRVGAALANLVISATLIGSVLLGFDRQATAASEMAIAAPTAGAQV